MEFLDLYSGKELRADYLAFLCQANQIEVRSIAEIGTWKGTNAQKLRQLFPQAKLYLIDPWQATPCYLEKGAPPPDFKGDIDSIYHKVCRQFIDDPQTKILRTTSIKGAPVVPSDLDLVFIDGDHSYEGVKEDIITWKKKVRPGGLLAGHDYNRDFPPVIQAVNELLEGKFIVGKDSVWATIIE